MSPLEALLLVMRQSVAEGNRAQIIAAASACAPYVHARLNAATVRVESDSYDSLSDEELMSEINRLEENIRQADKWSKEADGWQKVQ